MKIHHRRMTSQRGTVLIVALLLAGIIGLSLASFLRLSSTTHKISNRAFYNNAAMNISERGLEEAMYCVNKSVAAKSDLWTGWTLSGGDARQEWANLPLEDNATANLRVYVFNYAYANPAPKNAIARARVTLPGSSTTIDKWIQVTLKKTSKFANGMVAKDKIDLKGANVTIDSWKSDPDNDPATPPVAYSTDPSVRRANGSVAAQNLISIQNAKIYGYAATGGNITWNNGDVLASINEVPDGTPDPSRVDTNFSANLEDVTLPTTYTYTVAGVTQTANISWHPFGGAITDNITLPRTTGPSADPVSSDGKYYISVDSIGPSYNNKTLTISDKVVLHITGLNAIDIGGGSGALIINPGASLEVYTAGSIKIAGNGITNGGTTLDTANQPANCQIYSITTGSAQTIDIKGNGVLSALVYAPRAAVTITGGGTNGIVTGSIVGDTIKVGGNTEFHYDESLADFGVANPFRLSNWKELTTAAQRTVSTGATPATALNWSP